MKTNMEKAIHDSGLIKLQQLRRSKIGVRIDI